MISSEILICRCLKNFLSNSFAKFSSGSLIINLYVDLILDARSLSLKDGYFEQN